MKKLIKRLMVMGLMLTSLILVFTACTVESDVAETQWKVVNIKVNKNHWTWIEESGQYEVILDLPELSPFIFNEGAVMAYVKFNSDTKAMLPHTKSYSYFDDNNNIGYYTETIKCDFQVGSPSTVAFYIEASDLARADEYLEDRDFQVVMIW